MIMNSYLIENQIVFGPEGNVGSWWDIRYFLVKIDYNSS